MSDKIDINETLKEYQLLKTAYEDACKQTSIARSHETDCLNRLNRCQKEITEHMRSLASDAPRESDWKTKGRIEATGI